MSEIIDCWWERKRHGEKTWRECVTEHMRVLGFEKGDVQDMIKLTKEIMGKPSDSCKHGKNRR